MLKKLLLPFASVLLLTSCASKKEKENPANGGKENRTPTITEMTEEDRTIRTWLVGKEWKTEDGAAPFSLLKVYSEDSCGLTTGKEKYMIKKGRLHIFGAEWPLNRVNDSTFTIYVEPTQKTYSYKFAARL